MKFISNKADFFQALQRVIGVIPAKTTIPILGNILFALDGKRLQLTGTDLEVSILTTLEVDGQTPGSVTIPAKKIYDIVRELPEVPLQLEVDERFRATLASDKGQYRIVGQSSDEYPQIAAGQAESTLTYGLPRFLKMVETTQFAVSLDELRTTLMGVLLELREQELRMVATDGHRLVRYSDLSFRNKDRALQVIVPTKALHLLARNSDRHDTVELAIGENHIVFRTPATTIFSKLINGQFPNYERVIPTDNDQELIVEREALISAVRRVSLFANQTTQQVRFSLSKNSLSVQAEDEQVGGDAKETLPVVFKGSKMEIGYNSAYLLEILRHLETPEVLFVLKDPASAAILRPQAAAKEQAEGVREELMMLLMPIRLNDLPPDAN